jgi:hypothetical protein
MKSKMKNVWWALFGLGMIALITGIVVCAQGLALPGLLSIPSFALGGVIFRLYLDGYFWQAEQYREMKRRERENKQ